MKSKYSMLLVLVLTPILGCQPKASLQESTAPLQTEAPNTAPRENKGVRNPPLWEGFPCSEVSQNPVGDFRAGNVEASATWSASGNATVSGTLLAKAVSAADGWSAGGASISSLIYGPGFVEATVTEPTKRKAFGLSRTQNLGPAEALTSLDWGIEFNGAGYFTIWNREPSRHFNPMGGSYAAGDVFRISVDDTISTDSQAVAVIIYKNGSEIWRINHNSVGVSYPLKAIASLYSAGSSWDQVKLSTFPVRPVANVAYVRTDGNAYGTGAANRPLNLATALKGIRSIKPGTTVYLCGGTYKGLYTSNLAGTKEAKITLRPYPNEKVILDAFGQTGYVLHLFGAYTDVMDLEITDSNPSRVSSTDGSDIPTSTGVGISGQSIGVINNHIHNLHGNGIKTNTASWDFEVYGNILHDNGYLASGAPHGHALYLQGKEEVSGSRRIFDNIVFNPVNLGAQVWYNSEDQGYFLSDFWFEGNIFSRAAWLIGSNAPVKKITVRSNFTYGSGLTLGYGNPYNEDATVHGNLFYSWSPVVIKHFTSIDMKDNKIVGIVSNSGGSVNLILPPSNSLSAYSIDRNTYYRTRDWSWDFPVSAFNYQPISSTWDEWKALGFDLNGQWNSNPVWNQSTVPAANDVVIRRNTYDAKRAHVIVFNYRKQAQMDIDLGQAGIPRGAVFTLHDAQNFKGAPVYEGTYAGPIVLTLPTSASPVSQVSGNLPLVRTHTDREFSMYVLRWK